MRFEAPVVTIGWLLAVVLLLMAILLIVGVLPFTPLVVGLFFVALAVSRLL